MSDMVKRYEESKKPWVEKAKQIPSLATNFVDQQNKFQKGFVTFDKHGNPTTFTPLSLEYYNTELKVIPIPDGFQPTEQGINLNRWTPAHKYYNPGQK